MKREKLPTRLMDCYIPGTISRGRQPMTWLDNVRNNLTILKLEITEAVDLARE